MVNISSTLECGDLSPLFFSAEGRFDCGEGTVPGMFGLVLTFPGPGDYVGLVCSGTTSTVANPWLGEKSASPPKTASITWGPTGKVVVLKLHTVLALPVVSGVAVPGRSRQECCQRCSQA